MTRLEEDNVYTNMRAHRALFKIKEFLFGVSFSVIALTACGAEGVTVAAPGSIKWTGCGDEWPKGCEAAWVAGDPAKETSHWFCRAPKGALFPRHSHTGTERILVLQGRISGGVDGGGSTIVTPGTYLAFEGKAVHWARCEDDCLMYIIHDGAYDQAFH